MSLVETCASTLIGMGVAYLTQVTVFPMLGIEIPQAQHGVLVVTFTAVSLVRSYFVRRLFNALRD
jgi:hypothetical protein